MAQEYGSKLQLGLPSKHFIYLDINIYSVIYYVQCAPHSSTLSMRLDAGFLSLLFGAADLVGGRLSCALGRLASLLTSTH